MQLTMSGISTLSSGQAQWRELTDKGYNPFILAEQVSPSACHLSQHISCLCCPAVATVHAVFCVLQTGIDAFTTGLQRRTTLRM